MEDVPSVFQHKQRPHLARPEGPGKDLLSRTTSSISGKNASLAPSPDEDLQEEMVSCNYLS